LQGREKVVPFSSVYTSTVLNRKFLFLHRQPACRIVLSVF
jgi:hypothetical protein